MPPSRLVAMGNMDDLGLDGVVSLRSRGNVASYDGLSPASARSMKGRRASYIARARAVPHMAADDLAQGTFEPELVGLVDEPEDSIIMGIGDQENGSSSVIALNRPSLSCTVASACSWSVMSRCAPISL